MKTNTYRKILLLLALMSTGLMSNAQSDFMSSLGATDIIMIFTCSLLIIVIFAIIAMLLLFGQFVKHADVTFGKISLFSGFAKQLNDSVPVEEEETVMTEHVYDGIRELDNNLPPWWKLLFYATIVFSGVYLYVYELSDLGSSQTKEYEEEMIAAEKALSANVKLAGVSIDETNVPLSDAKGIANGMEMFQNFCAACHGKAGEGGVGPNLTDEYWLHGGSVTDIFKTIKYGVPQKGMIAWKSQLSGSDIKDIASYISSIQGSNPPNAKEPQGEKAQK